MASLQSEETQPEGESAEIHSSSPPRVICSHHQHLADYVRLFMEEGEGLSPDENQVTPLITIVSFYMFLVINLPFHSNSSLLSYAISHLIFRCCKRFSLLVILEVWQTYCILTQYSSKKWLHWVHQQPK